MIACVLLDCVVHRISCHIPRHTDKLGPVIKKDQTSYREGQVQIL